MNEEGVYQGGGDHEGSGMGGGTGIGGSMHEPAAWPRAAEELMPGRGWWPTVLATAGSLATIVGAALFARRRRRSGLMAAMPAPILEASEQMMRGRGGGANPVRALVALGLVALAGWGLKRTMAHQA